MYYYLFVVLMGFEPMTHSLAYYTCFYTSQLNKELDDILLICLLGTIKPILSCCSLDYFITLLEMLQLYISITASFSCIEYLTSISVYHCL